MAWPCRGMGQVPPTLCWDGVRAFFKFNGKIIGRGEEIVANLQRSRGLCKNFHWCPPLLKPWSRSCIPVSEGNKEAWKGPEIRQMMKCSARIPHWLAEDVLVPLIVPCKRNLNDHCLAHLMEFIKTNWTTDMNCTQSNCSCAVKRCRWIELPKLPPVSDIWNNLRIYLASPQIIF